MNNRLNASERAHLARIKAMPCSVCDAPGPSDAHHVRQHIQVLCIPLCQSCHTGPLGWHGTKAHWRVRKMDELDALAVTLKRLLGNA